MVSNKRLTWSDASGNWGVEGVDLSALPTRLYAALWKLKDMEKLVEQLTSSDITDDAAEEALTELLGERSRSHEHGRR